jgi:competence protein ComFC
VKVSLRERVGGLARLVELLVYPSKCRLCSRLLEKTGERVVCRGCLETIVPEGAPHCLRCGRFFAEAGEPHICSTCLSREPAFSLHRSYGRYDGALRDLLLLYKYGKTSLVGKILAEHISRSPGSTDELWQGVDWVIPVPLHPKRERERGFNQSEILALWLSSRRGVGMTAGSLVKTENTPPQTSLEAAERITNVRGVYGVKKAARIAGRVVLLVDDVFTTGATLSECAGTLLRAGVAEVRAMTVAQA